MLLFVASGCAPHRTTHPLRMVLLVLILQASAERFPMLGVGRCMFDGEPLQGLSGILSGGNEHIQCRNMCSFIGDGCLGFTWNHCLHECILHGMPMDLAVVNRTSAVTWGSADACPITPMRPHSFMTAVGGSFPSGGKNPTLSIQAEGGECSPYACFIHEKPCKANFEAFSNDAYIWVQGLFAPNENVELPCPAGFGGSLTFQCSGVGEMVRIFGRCGHDCEEQNLNIPGFEPLLVPARLHGEAFDPGCRVAAPGTEGDLVFICDDNKYITKGICGQNCAAAVTEDGGFPVSASLHGVTEERPCPSGYSGIIRVECNNAQLKTFVECQRNCLSAIVQVETIGSDPVKIPLLDRTHLESTKESCPAGYTGELEVVCFNGMLTSKGTCGKDCTVPGTKKFGPVEASWTDMMKHGEVIEVECFEGGRIDIQCNGGEVSALSESCYFACEQSTFVNNGQRTEVIPAMIHSENYTVSCPPGSTGILSIQCWKGFFRHLDGFCGLDCAAGSHQLPSGVYVFHEDIRHESLLSAECEQGYVGNVELSCTNDVTEPVSGNCQPDVTDCVGAIQIVYNNDAYIKQWFTAERIDYMFDVTMNIGESKTLACPTGWGPDVVVNCLEGQRIETIGSCAFPCGLDPLTGAELANSVPPRAHSEEIRTACTDFPELEAYSRCNNGTVEVVNFCGKACNSSSLNAFTDGMLNPNATAIMVTHSFNITAKCDAENGFSGSPIMTCANGNFEGPVEGECGLRCVNETVAADMDHLETEELPCDPGHSGKQSRKCIDGEIDILPPQCFAECTTYSYVADIVPPPGQRYWEAPMQHGEETVNCSSLTNDTAIDGQVTRSCNDGYGHISALDCRRNCLDAELDSGSYDFPIKISVLLHDVVEAFPCGHPYFTALYEGTYSLTCTHGVLSVVEFNCIAHCEPGIIVSNGVEVSHELIQLGVVVSVPCDRYSANSLTITCNNQKVIIIEGWCFHSCQAGVVNNYAHGKMIDKEEVDVDCNDGFTGKVTVVCNDGTTTIKSNRCASHCPQSVVYPGGPPVSVLPYKHDTVNTVPCERGFANVQCYNGNLNVKDIYTSICGYKMHLCTCCPTVEKESYTTGTKNSRAHRDVILWLAVLLY